MASGRRRNAPAVLKNAVVEKALKTDETDEKSLIVLDDSSLELGIAELRGRWELASVLNFLSVFEPVIGSDLKLTAEEIETGLVKPNSSLAQLHINLLKGIPPVSKTLNVSEAWVTALCKKIATWWPWVAEGEIPLTAGNGKEISRYKELKPTNRLQILKALCEIRADQDDAVCYINDALKSGTEISCFRKEKIGGDGNATSYWCDGGTVIGYRLYKEARKTEAKMKTKGKASSSLPAISIQWQTLATNLEEFQTVVDECSSSKVMGENAVGKTIETSFLPAVEKLHKKKERALKQKQRQERLLNDLRSCRTGITRSCRNRRPISYTFDEYDCAIDEAIEIIKKRKTSKEQRIKKKHIGRGESAFDMGTELKESCTNIGHSDTDTNSKDENMKQNDSSDSETESDQIQQEDDGDDDYNSKHDSDNDNSNKSGNSDEKENNPGDQNCSQKLFGSRWSKRLAGGVSHPAVATGDLAAKNRMRQRPTRNTALDSVVPDSEDENMSEKTKGETSEHEDFPPIADSEEWSDG